MFSLILSFFLFVGQTPNYTYTSENAVFRGSPAFVISVNASSETSKTIIKTSRLPEPKIEPKPFKIDPRSVKPLSLFTSVETEIKSKPLQPIAVEKETRKVSETVYFDLDSSELKYSEKEKLDRLSRDNNYKVTGYTCDIGSKEYNDRLALRRARAVQNYLGDIVKEIDGKGKCCYIDSKDKAKNRRAEIKPLN